MPPEYDPKYAFAPESASKVGSIGSHVCDGHATGVMPGRPTPAAGAIAATTNSAAMIRIRERMHTPSRKGADHNRGGYARAIRLSTRPFAESSLAVRSSIFTLCDRDFCDTVLALPGAARPRVRFFLLVSALLRSSFSSTMSGRRYTVLIADRSTGVLRRVTVSLRAAIAVVITVLMMPVLIGLGAKWSAHVEIDTLRSTASSLQVE